MKIGLVIPYNPLEEIGGLEVGTVRLALAFKKLGHETIIITRGKTGFKKNIFIQGKKDIKDISHYLLKDKNLDIVQWMEIFPDPKSIEIQSLVSGALNHFGKKVFLMVATSKNLERRGKGKFVKNLITNLFNGYIVSNLAQIEEFRKYGISKNVFPIGLGIDTQNIFFPVGNDRKKQLRKKLNLPVDKIIILFIGRFVKRKRAIFLLDVWQTLVPALKRISLVMIGSGMGQHDSVEKKVLDVAQKCSNLILRKFGFNVRASDYFQACDIFVLPSIREGQPNVLLEAMACGMPVIGSNISGINELLTHEKNGLLFSPDNFKCLRNSIFKLVDNKELRVKLGKKARKLIRRVKDIDSVVQQYIKIYNK